MRRLIFLLLFVMMCSVVLANSNGCSEFIDLDKANCLIEIYKKDRDKVVLEKAISILESINENSPNRDNLLGVKYASTLDDDVMSQAEMYLLRAEEQGHILATHNLAEFYFAIDDYENARLYLGKVSQQNNQPYTRSFINEKRLLAQVMYLQPTYEGEKVRAVSIFEDIKEYDSSGTSHYFLGFHQLDLGCVSEALLLFKEAIALGHVESMSALADIYYNGVQVPKDLNEAEKLYLRAGELGDGRSYFHLVYIAKIQGDEELAWKYMAKSAEAGYKEAIDFLSSLEEE